MPKNSSTGKNGKRRLPILAFIEKYVDCHGYSPSDREIQQSLNVPIGNVHYHINEMEKKGWIASTKTEKGRRRPGTIHLTDDGRKALAAFVPDQSLQAVLSTLEGPRKQGQVSNPDPSPATQQPQLPGIADKPPRDLPRPVHDAHYMILSAQISNRGVGSISTIPVYGLISASFNVLHFSSDASLSDLDPESYLSINQDMLPANLKTEKLYALEVRGDSMIDVGIHSGDFVILRPTHTAENGDMCAVRIDDEETTLKYFYREEKRVRLEPANSSIPPKYLGPSHTVQIQGQVVLVVRE